MPLVPWPCHPALPLPGPARPQPPPLARELGVPPGCRCCCIVMGVGSTVPATGPGDWGHERLQTQGFVHGSCEVRGGVFPGTGSRVLSPGEVTPGLQPPYWALLHPLDKDQPGLGLTAQGEGWLLGRRREKPAQLVPVPCAADWLRELGIVLGAWGHWLAKDLCLCRRSYPSPSDALGAPVLTRLAALHPACRNGGRERKHKQYGARRAPVLRRAAHGRHLPASAPLHLLSWAGREKGGSGVVGGGGVPSAAPRSSG